MPVTTTMPIEKRLDAPAPEATSSGNNPPTMAAVRLRVGIAPPGAALTRCDHAGLEALRGVIPVARSLPLLQALARGVSTELVLEYLDGLSLTVQVDFAPP